MLAEKYNGFNINICNVFVNRMSTKALRSGEKGQRGLAPIKITNPPPVVQAAVLAHQQPTSVNQSCLLALRLQACSSADTLPKCATNATLCVAGAADSVSDGFACSSVAYPGKNTGIVELSVAGDAADDNLASSSAADPAEVQGLRYKV